MRKRFGFILLVALDILLLLFLLFLIVHQRRIWEGREGDLRAIKDLEYQLNYESSLLLPAYLDPLAESYSQYFLAVERTEEGFRKIRDLPYLDRIIGKDNRISVILEDYRGILSGNQKALLESLRRAQTLLEEADADNTYQIISINDFAKRRWLLDEDDLPTFSDFLDYQVISDITDLNVALFAGTERIEEIAVSYARIISRRRQWDIILLILLTNLFFIPHLVAGVGLLVNIRSERSLSLARSVFFSMVSHELRTPLNVIIGLVRLMGKGDLSPAQRDRLKKLEGTSRDLLSLINDVLDYSKLDSGKMTLERKPYSPVRFMEHLSETYSSLIEDKGLRMILEIDGGLPLWVYGDAFRLRQIMANLLSNAVKFTREGSVTLGAKLLSREGPRARIRYFVADTGMGIPPEKRDRLFKPYSQLESSTSRQFGGTGLGLSISSRLIALMGGEISFADNRGGGTLFYADIPCDLLSDEEAIGQDREEERRGGDGQALYPGSRVLLVEDHPINREIMEEILKEREIGVTTAGDGAEGLEKWESGDFDMIFMDVLMPVMNGYEASEEIRRREKGERHIPIIAMTAFAMEEDRERSVRSGMDGHITKPLSLDDLNQTLNIWLPSYRRAPGTEEAPPHSASLDLLRREFHDLDIDSGLERVGHNLPVYLELLNAALREGDGNFAALEEYLSRQDPAGAAALCHAWRGPLGNLGAESLFRELLDWETALNGGNVPDEGRRRELQRKYREMGERLDRIGPSLSVAGEGIGVVKPPDPGKKKILLVDDTPINIRMIMTFLGDSYDYHIALDGEKALSILEKVTPDLMLVDVMMPVMDGFAFCGAVKSRRELAGIPLIFLTALKDESEEAKGRSLGGADFIYKPFDPDHLRRAVEENLRPPGSPE